MDVINHPLFGILGAPQMTGPSDRGRFIAQPNVSVPFTIMQRVSELLPNVESLASILEHATGARADVETIVEAVTTASTIDDLDEAIGTVVDGWRNS